MSAASHLGKEFVHLLGILDFHFVCYRSVDLMRDIAVLVPQAIGHALNVHALHEQASPAIQQKKQKKKHRLGGQAVKTVLSVRDYNVI